MFLAITELEKLDEMAPQKNIDELPKQDSKKQEKGKKRPIFPPCNPIFSGKRPAPTDAKVRKDQSGPLKQPCMEHNWTHVRNPLAMQELPLISLYACSRCQQLTHQRDAIRFSSGMHYLTLVQCAGCLEKNKTLANALSDN